jgi:IclR family mhp operon transcriptional activator
MRAGPGFDEVEEARLRALLERTRELGYARRDPRTRPLETTTLGVPLMERGRIAALMTISFYRSAVAPARIEEDVVRPLMETRANIEHALEFVLSSGDAPGPPADEEIGPDF